MSAPDEKRAAWVLFAVALLGVAVRWVGDPGRPDPTELDTAPASADRPSIDSVEARSRRVGRPLAPGERIDLDIAPAFEIARLRGVGPTLAARIVSYRDSAGPFGSLEAFDRVPGVGPAMMSAVENSVTFGRRQRRPRRVAPGNLVPVNRANATMLARLPGIGAVKAEAIVRTREANGPFRSVEDLASVPGIGPALVESLRPRVRIP